MVFNPHQADLKLDLCYNALAGSASSWVHFYGITRLPKGFGIESESQTEDDGILCLVFERATKGNLHDFLKQTTLKDDWGFIIEAGQGIGGGLDELHKRGIAHRYPKVWSMLIMLKRSSSWECINHGRRCQ